MLVNVMIEQGFYVKVETLGPEGTTCYLPYHGYIIMRSQVKSELCLIALTILMESI